MFLNILADKGDLREIQIHIFTEVIYCFQFFSQFFRPNFFNTVLVEREHEKLDELDTVYLYFIKFE